MDILKLLAKSPLVLGIIDLESAVWRHEGWLDGREVCPEDVGAGVLLREVDGPGACSGGEVEDVVNAGGEGAEGGAVQLAVEGEAHYLVLEVEAVLFFLNRGKGGVSHFDRL